MMQAGQKRRISSTVLLVVLVLAAMLARLLIPYRYVSDRAPADAWYRAIQIGMPEEEWLPIIRESPDGEILYLADSSFKLVGEINARIIMNMIRIRAGLNCSPAQKGILKFLIRLADWNRETNRQADAPVGLLPDAFWRI